MTRPTKAKGYEAARFIVKEMLDAVDRPNRSKVNTKSVAYRSGYFMGLLSARCHDALGDFPKDNVEVIRQALARKYGQPYVALEYHEVCLSGRDGREATIRLYRDGYIDLMHCKRSTIKRLARLHKPSQNNSKMPDWARPMMAKLET